MVCCHLGRKRCCHLFSPSYADPMEQFGQCSVLVRRAHKIWVKKCPRAAKEGVIGVQLYPHPKLGGVNISFCTPKNLEGALHSGRSVSHWFSLKVYDIAPVRQFDNVEVFTGSLSLSRSKFVSLPAGQMDFLSTMASTKMHWFPARHFLMPKSFSGVFVYQIWETIPLFIECGLRYNNVSPNAYIGLRNCMHETTKLLVTWVRCGCFCFSLGLHAPRALDDDTVGPNHLCTRRDRNCPRSPGNVLGNSMQTCSF